MGTVTEGQEAVSNFSPPYRGPSVRILLTPAKSQVAKVPDRQKLVPLIGSAEPASCDPGVMGDEERALFISVHSNHFCAALELIGRPELARNPSCTTMRSHAAH